MGTRGYLDGIYTMSHGWQRHPVLAAATWTGAAVHYPTTHAIDRHRKATPGSLVKTQGHTPVNRTYLHTTGLVLREPFDRV